MSAVITGLESVIQNPPGCLKAKRIGLLSNPASVDTRYRHASQLISEAFPGQLRALFGPQHGIRGEKQDNMVESGNEWEPALDIPVFSLYGAVRSPTPEMLREIEVLVVDIQDVGTRVYTFIQSLALCMEACVQSGITIVVLDRPNPLGGVAVEGPLLRQEFRSFVGLCPLPLRHGLTVGELARLYADLWIQGCAVEVIPMEGWRRDMMFTHTGLPWVMTSPNMPTMDTALVYPGQVILEGTNLSEGRGTTRPFEIFGAPFIQPHKLAAALKVHKIPGIVFREAYFEPAFHKWTGQLCGGLQLHVADASLFRPLFTTVAILREVMDMYPGQFAWRPPPYEYEYEKLPVDIILGGDELRLMLAAGASAQEIESSWQKEQEEFKRFKQAYHLYQ
ncbi:MAG: DUF1343 domain-containing protein [Deltaproteobacteria bacterium]|nr:DUF1343 domain-containing protein [Deltaproteobacteria bacterium]